MIEQCWVIKNKDGYYVNPNFGALFTGITTGFVCFNNKCGLNYPVCIKEKCGRYVSYNSLNEGLSFKSFDECREAVIKWHKNHG